MRQLQEQEIDGPEPAQLLLRLPLHASLNSCVDFPLFLRDWIPRTTFTQPSDLRGLGTKIVIHTHTRLYLPMPITHHLGHCWCEGRYTRAAPAAAPGPPGPPTHSFPHTDAHHSPSWPSLVSTQAYQGVRLQLPLDLLAPCPCWQPSVSSEQDHPGSSCSSCPQPNSSGGREDTGAGAGG